MSKLVYFDKKAEAIDYCKKNADPSKKIINYLFQMDKEKSDSKTFLVGGLDEVWNLIKAGKNSLYESWEDNPIHFGLDIDIPRNKDGKCDKYEKYEDVIIHIQQMITNILLVINNLSDDFSLSAADVIILENENQQNEKTKNYSFHVIFKGFVMENYRVAGQFFDSLKHINLDGCDKSIYRKTCLRTCFSKKQTKQQVLIPKIIDILNKKTDNENNYSNLKDFWKASLICNTEDYDIVLHENEEDDEEIEKAKSKKDGKPVDLTHIEKIIMELPEKYYSEYYYWSKIGMILRNLANDEKETFEVWDKFSKQSKDKYKGRSDLIKHWNGFKGNNRKNKIGLGSLFLWCKEENISFSDKKGLDVIVEEYPKRELIVSYNHKEINKRYFPITEMHDLWKHKLICIQSEKGTGKTTSLFKYLFDNEKLTKDDSVLFVSSRRTFGIKLFGDIQKYGFKLYSECKEYYIDHNKMICQVDSILRLTQDKFKYVIIDECESLMRYLTSSHFTKNNKASLIVSNLEMKIAEAEKVVVMDADLCDRSINYFKETMCISDEDLEKTMKVVVNKFQPYNDYTVEYMAYSTWLKVLMDKLDNKKKIVIPTASNNQAKDLKLLIESHHPSAKILLIHRETSDNEKLSQVINVNEKWATYDIVIYTPSVCMGISFDEEHFDHIFAYGCENSLGSQEFCQMLHRIRKPKEMSIYLTLDKFEEYNPERHEIGLLKIEQVISYDYYLTYFDLHNNLIKKKYKPNTVKSSISKIMEGSGGNILIMDDDEENQNNIKDNEDIQFIEEKKFMYPYKDEPIYKVYLKNAQELISDRLNFGNQLFGYFKMKGYKLKKHDWEDGDLIKNELKEIRELRKEDEMNKEIDGIFNSVDITDDQYKELMGKRKEDLTQDDIFKLQKRNFKKCYVLDNISKEILAKYKDLNIMKHYHNLSVILPRDDYIDPETGDKVTDTVDKRLDEIRLDRVNNSYINNAYADLTTKNSFTRHKWAINIIKMLGFSLMDLGIRLPSKTVEDIVSDEWIKEYDKSLEYFVHKYNLAFPKKKLTEMESKERIKFLSKITESQYGLSITKDSAKNYYLSDFNKWDDLYEYREGKSSMGVPLKQKVIKKEKTNINIDQSWFEE